jgi:transcriptional regulator with XRE-family HTH domain
MSAFGSSAQQKRLAAELKRLRVRAGLSGREVARRMDASQSTVSKIETGEQKRVTADLIVRWAKATDAPEESLTELLALNEQIQLGPQSWEDASETGTTDFARETAALEAATGTLSNYQPAAVPGLLQTPAYAVRLLSSGPAGVPADLAGRVMGRIERQRVLSDQGKRFRFVIPEAVLRWPYGPPDDPAVINEHREQLGVIEQAIGRPNMEVGILPLGPVAVWRLSGFVIFDDVEGDDPQVHLEWLTRPYNITEPEQVEMCRQAFANLLSASVTGDEARRLITAAAADLRPA